MLWNSSYFVMVCIGNSSNWSPLPPRQLLGKWLYAPKGSYLCNYKNENTKFTMVILLLSRNFAIDASIRSFALCLTLAPFDDISDLCFRLKVLHKWTNDIKSLFFFWHFFLNSYWFAVMGNYKFTFSHYLSYSVEVT